MNDGSLSDRFKQILADTDQAVFFCDLLGGTPFKEAVKLSNQLGKDIAVIGFNNISLTAQLPIPLTTIASPMSEMGFTAMELLLKKINKEQVDSIKLVPKLIKRNSTLDYLVE